MEGFLKNGDILLQRGEFDFEENHRKIAEYRRMLMHECTSTFGLEATQIKDPTAMAVLAYSWRLCHSKRFVDFSFLQPMADSR